MPKETEEETEKSQEESDAQDSENLGSTKSKEQDFVGLEEEIEEAEENIDNTQFHEFLQPSAESSAPVLERVATTPEPINLEQDIAFTPTSAEQTEETSGSAATSNTPDYSAGTTEREEVTNYEPPVLRPLNISENLPRPELLDPLADVRTNPQDNIEPRRIESEFREETRRLPFETREERKYKEARL